ncbi:MAG: zinc-ribbon domain-containing protein [Bacillota bacterium]|nr:zinc-ribbon domain-containing protein [Bacillota bacterium]
MAFFDDFGKKVGNAVDVTAAKTKEVAFLTKLNMQISSEKRKMERLYTEIGKLTYERENGKPDSFVSEQCLEIDKIKKIIEELDKKLKEV